MEKIEYHVPIKFPAKQGKFGLEELLSVYGDSCSEKNILLNGTVPLQSRPIELGIHPRNY